MSGNDGGGRPTIPFGYQYVGSQAQSQSEHASHAPSGPPLLEPSETSLLQTFFENPNNIDPSFLALSQDRQEHQDVYSGAQQWMFESLQQEPGAHVGHTPQHSSTLQAFGPHQGASDDVYNAAKLLHSHQSAFQNESFHSPGFVANPHAPQAQMYSYPQSQVTQSGYQSSSSEQTSPTTQNMYGAVMQAGPVAAHRPEPLHFGSDSKFRESKYITPNVQRPPDQELMGMLSTFSRDTDESPTQTRQVSPGPSRRKRRRSSLAGSCPGESEEEAESSNKRGKVRTKAEEASDDEPGSSRGRYKRAVSTRAKAFSPGQRRKSSPTSRKPARENLTEEQKRSNHIQSEQKRRNLIKLGFEDTNRMVPELRAGGFSKSNMLQEAAKFMRELKEGNDRVSAIVGLLDKG